jgi:hypothetical protein
MGSSVGRELGILQGGATVYMRDGSRALMAAQLAAEKHENDARLHVKLVAEQAQIMEVKQEEQEAEVMSSWLAWRVVRMAC